MEIKEIEKRIVDLTMEERSLAEERSRARNRLLYNAEKLPVVNRVMKEFVQDILGLTGLQVKRTSDPLRFGGRDDEEFLSEIAVTLIVSDIAQSPVCEGATGLSLRIVVNQGFDDAETRAREKEIMDRLLKIREEIESLNGMRRSLKRGQG